MDTRNLKARFRRAKARQGLGDIDGAVKDIQLLYSFEPKNAAVKNFLLELCPHFWLKGAGPSAWASGLRQKFASEWLVDCYRMRIDEEYVWRGGDLRGLYALHAGGGSRDMVEKDFLLFCKLAVKNGVIPVAPQLFIRVHGGRRFLLVHSFNSFDSFSQPDSLLGQD